MLAEVANALCLTYIATEYTISSQETTSSRRFGENQDDTNDHFGRKARTKRGLVVIGIVVAINIIDRYLGLATFGELVSRETHYVIYALLHVPRALVAAIAYLGALFWDCQRTVARQRKRMTFIRDFLPRVTKAFLTVLPIYPLAAIIISFGFLILITIFEKLHIPESLLNWPIYYGTLYGPFSYIYHIVKLSVVRENQWSLPSSTGGIKEGGGVRLGGG